MEKKKKQPEPWELTCRTNSDDTPVLFFGGTEV
jgi:hypothetical protein